MKWRRSTIVDSEFTVLHSDESCNGGGEITSRTSTNTNKQMTMAANGNSMLVRYISKLGMGACVGFMVQFIWYNISRFVLDFLLRGGLHQYAKQPFVAVSGNSGDEGNEDDDDDGHFSLWLWVLFASVGQGVLIILCSAIVAQASKTSAHGMSYCADEDSEASTSDMKHDQYGTEDEKEDETVSGLDADGIEDAIEKHEALYFCIYVVGVCLGLTVSWSLRHDNIRATTIFAFGAFYFALRLFFIPFSNIRCKCNAPLSTVSLSTPATTSIHVPFDPEACRNNLVQPLMSSASSSTSLVDHDIERSTDEQQANGHSHLAALGRLIVRGMLVGLCVGVFFAMLNVFVGRFVLAYVMSDLQNSSSSSSSSTENNLFHQQQQLRSFMYDLIQCVYLPIISVSQAFVAMQLVPEILIVDGNCSSGKGSSSSVRKANENSPTLAIKAVACMSVLAGFGLAWTLTAATTTIVVQGIL